MFYSIFVFPGHDCTCGSDDEDQPPPAYPLWIWILGIAAVGTYSLIVTIIAFVNWVRLITHIWCSHTKMHTQVTGTRWRAKSFPLILRNSRFVLFFLTIYTAASVSRSSSWREKILKVTTWTPNPERPRATGREAFSTPYHGTSDYIYMQLRGPITEDKRGGNPSWKFTLDLCLWKVVD